MTYNIKLAKTGWMLILTGLFFILIIPGTGRAQTSSGLSAEELDKELRKALILNDKQKALDLIKGNRLLIKPFVDGLVRESIMLDLKGKIRESEQTKMAGEKAASYFEGTFGEKSLALGVNYLTVWSKEDKKMKLKADSLYSAGTKLRLNNDKENALACFWPSLELYNGIGDERGEAEVLGGFGALYFNNFKSNQEALDYYLAALKLREKVDDRQLMANTLNSLGSVYTEFQKDYATAIQYYEKAEAIRNEITDRAGLRSVKFNKANAYKLYGDHLNVTGKFDESLAALGKAYDIFQGIGEETSAGDVLSIMGFVYSKLGDYNSAAEKLTEAAAVMKKQNDTIGLAGVYNNFGIVLQRAGRTERASEYYNNALALYEKSGQIEDIIPVIGNLGTLFFEAKDYGIAEEYHIRGLQLCREVNDSEKEVDFLLNLANDVLLLERPDEAISFYKEGNEKAREISNPDIVWRTLVGMAECYEKKGDYTRVIELNDSALAIIDSLRGSISDDQLRATLMARERYIFEDIIDLLTTLHENDEVKGYDRLAFRYAEQSKSRVLLDLLSGSKDPEPAVIESGKTELVSLDEAKAFLAGGKDVFLEYSVGDSSSCLWVIAGKEHGLFRIPSRKILQEQVETIRFGLLDPDQKVSNMSEIAAGMYEELVKPAEPFLLKNSRIVIIPDGILNYLPFEVLIASGNRKDGSKKEAGLPFLVKKYPVSYAPSISVLRTMIRPAAESEAKIKGTGSLLAFGDPLYDDLRSPGLNKFQRLPFSAREVENIASDFAKGSSVLFLREKATEEALKANKELSKFGYIHFATHGSINEEDPEMSSLVLGTEEGSSEDGFLHPSEIMDLDLNASLVVLSACQSGLGKLVRGEGIIGLTRAFMYAGTPSVVAGLWSVADESTSVLMGEFYKYLIKENLGKTEALRKAQIDLINSQKYSHPFYWAPFILTGDWK